MERNLNMDKGLLSNVRVINNIIKKARVLSRRELEFAMNWLDDVMTEKRAEEIVSRQRINNAIENNFSHANAVGE